jgi:hypothetical protein
MISLLTCGFFIVFNGGLTKGARAVRRSPSQSERNSVLAHNICRPVRVVQAIAALPRNARVGQDPFRAN